MSHKIDIKTTITQKEPAKKALQKKGWNFQELGNSLRINSGPMSGATINLNDGSIIGDTDWHDRNKLGALNQGYAEALVEDDIMRQGGDILERQVMKDGTIKIRASMRLGA